MLFIWLVGVNLPLGWCWWGVCAYKQLCTLPKHHSHLTTNRMSETNKTEWWKATTPVSYNPGTSLLGGFNCWLCTICMYTSLIWTVKPQCSQMGLTTVAYLWLILSGKIRENSRQKTGCKVSLCAFTDTNSPWKHPEGIFRERFPTNAIIHISRFLSICKFLTLQNLQDKRQSKTKTGLILTCLCFVFRAWSSIPSLILGGNGWLPAHCSPNDW